MAIVFKLKNVTNGIRVRNGDDTGDALLVALEILLSGGTLANGRVLTSDASGLGSWQVNPAIQAAADAQADADAAQAAADAAQSTANTANTNAGAAQSTANTAVTNAATAQATATSAAGAAATAQATAVAAGAAAAAAEATAVAAGAAAAAAGVAAAGAAAVATSASNTANTALALAADSLPVNLAIEADEFIYDTGSPTRVISSTFMHNYAVFTSTNLAEMHLDVILRGGYWTFVMVAMARNDAARVSVSVGGVVIADPQELYSAVTNNVARFVYTDVQLPDGLHRVIIKADGHHPSSSGYLMLISKFSGYKTA